MGCDKSREVEVGFDLPFLSVLATVVAWQILPFAFVILSLFVKPTLLVTGDVLSYIVLVRFGCVDTNCPSLKRNLSQK